MLAEKRNIERHQCRENLLQKSELRQSAFSHSFGTMCFCYQLCSYLQTVVTTFSRQAAASEMFRPISWQQPFKRCTSEALPLHKATAANAGAVHNSTLPQQVGSCKKTNFSGLDHLTIAIAWIIQFTKPSKCKQQIKQQPGTVLYSQKRHQFSQRAWQLLADRDGHSHCMLANHRASGRHPRKIFPCLENLYGLLSWSRCFQLVKLGLKPMKVGS